MSAAFCPDAVAYFKDEGGERHKQLLAVGGAMASAHQDINTEVGFMQTSRVQRPSRG